MNHTPTKLTACSLSALLHFAAVVSVYLKPRLLLCPRMSVYPHKTRLETPALVNQPSTSQLHIHVFSIIGSLHGSRMTRCPDTLQRRWTLEEGTLVQY